MDSNHRTPKRTDLQSVAVGHLATCPAFSETVRTASFASQRRDSNPRPADYKSAALPTELLWLIWLNELFLHRSFSGAPPSILIIHPIFGEAKVSEFVKFKNFDFFFLPVYQFQPPPRYIPSYLRPSKQKKDPLSEVFTILRSKQLVCLFSF
jgi:hypothetical protein